MHVLRSFFVGNCRQQCKSRLPQLTCNPNVQSHQLDDTKQSKQRFHLRGQIGALAAMISFNFWLSGSMVSRLQGSGREAQEFSGHRVLQVIGFRVSLSDWGPKWITKSLIVHGMHERVDCETCAVDR
eukprot:6486138-Amphidinium_carterae.1